MNCACELFYKILPNDAATVQAWAALITTGIAGYALFSWKHQKKYDLTIEALSKISHIQNLTMQEIFSYQLALEDLQLKNNSRQLHSNDIYNTAIRISEISDKYDNIYFEIGFYKTIELIKRNYISNKIVSNIYLGIKNARDKHLIDQLIKIIIKYVDNKPTITNDNVKECIEDFKHLSIISLPNLAKEYNKLSTNPKQTTSTD